MFELETMEYGQYSSYSAEAAAEEEAYATSSTSSMARKKKNKNTKRFSDEQIKSLETMFETETRLEPRKKLQLARELGLQPRQVAIWFQNKRARWKSKQLEREYNKLQNSYNSLASRFESMKKEKQTLLIQLQKLNDLIQKPIIEQSQSSSQVKETNSMESESENCGTIKCEAEVKPRTSMERSERVFDVVSDDDTSIKVEYFGLEDEHGLMSFAEHGDGSLTSPENWSGFETNDLLGESSCDYQWWDFWS